MQEAQSAPNPTSLWGGPATLRQRGAAATVVAAAGAATALTLQFRSLTGPVIGPFIPMAVTLWTGADALTAFLLLALFWIDGSSYLAFVAAAYAVSGLLSIPYVIEFPGAFSNVPATHGLDQVSVYLWACWHASFPLVLGVATVLDPQVRRRVAPRDRLRVLLAVLFCTLALAGGLATLITAAPERLPAFISGHHFTALFLSAVAPALILCNLATTAIVLAVARPLRPLHIWLAVAMTVAALDALLNVYSTGRYSTTWYVGKLETLLASGVVLAILLGEIVALFARSIELSAIDVLTGLRNRRAFNEYVTRAFATARRRQSSLTAIMLDVDQFKQFNDHYGHAAGDVCLRRVAEVIAAAATRSEDLAARYGGEEFIVILPATSLAGAQVVAEGIRSGIEALGIEHVDSDAGIVTASLGVACVQHGAGDPAKLFELADLALYEAKRNGRNCVCVSRVEILPSSPEQLRSA